MPPKSAAYLVVLQFILHFNNADFDSAQSAAMDTQSCLLSLSKHAKFQTEALPLISLSRGYYKTI